MVNLKWKSFFSLSLLFLSFYSPLPLLASSPVNYKFIWPEGVTTLHQKIDVACRQFGCDAGKAKRIMWCESKDKQSAVNWTEPGHPRGVYQFKQQTFDWLARETGIPNANIYDVDPQVYIFTYTLAKNPQLVRQHWACF